MRCDKCKRVLRNDWDFCPTCGYSLRTKTVMFDENDIDLIDKALKNLSKEIKK